jgi:predicted tellurium resistance membrane protein TerC
MRQPDRGLWIASAVFAVLVLIGIPTLVGWTDSEGLLIFAFPGMMIASMLTQNLHDPNPFLSVLCAWAFWMIAFVLGRKLWRKIRGH